MVDISFEWDSRKDTANLNKHGIAFAEAMTVFYDEEALLLHDAGHSRQEDRFLLLGISGRLRMLIVCHCHRQEETIRIISARRATRQERKQYVQRWRQ